MDNDGNEVSENDKTRLGMKICTHITHPKLFIAADEVGFNTCQKCDDRKGGARNILQAWMCTVSTNREERQSFYIAWIEQLVRVTSMRCCYCD